MTARMVAAVVAANSFRSSPSSATPCKGVPSVKLVVHCHGHGSIQVALWWRRGPRLDTMGPKQETVRSLMQDIC